MADRLNTVHGATVSFHDINYTVKVKKEPKRILKNVSGIFKPGMNAILGPTGGGKTSLLDILAGRKDPKGLNGQVLIDGQPQPSNFKCVSGYVVQDDVVMGTLTVRENLMFSANLRLPKSVPIKEKKGRVTETITQLGLENCADSKVGTEFIRGISGGERKRTNIGMELVIAPRVLFLDEPTTGLDASTAGAVMKLVQRLSTKGHTIIFSIHQPRFSIFRLIDSLMLLSLGQTVYHGPADQAVKYFSTLGYQCEQFNNPPDFFLDVINGDSSAVRNIDLPNERETDNSIISGGDLATSVVALPLEEFDEGDLATHLSAQYEKSETFSSISEELKTIYKAYEGSNQKSVGSNEKIDYVNSFFTQMNWVSRRTMLNIIRNPATFIMQFGVITVMALIVGIVYFQLSNVLPQAIQNRAGAFFLITMNQIFSNMSALDLFIRSRKIFMHENVSGFYRVSTYFLAKVFCDLLPMRVIPVLIFSCITYFMIGLNTNVGDFFFFVLMLFMTQWSAASLCFLISSTVEIFALANLLLALIFVLMMVFGGLFVNIATVVVWLRWLQYLSIFRYSVNGLMISQMKNEVFCTVTNLTTVCNEQAGNAYLESQGVPYQTDWDMWLNPFALFCMGLGMLFLTYIQLRRLKKTT